MFWRAFACIALGLLTTLPALAQGPQHTWQAYRRSFHFQHLDGRDGLAQNSVSLIFQDQRGFIWLATQGGLFRYDGYSLQRFSHDPNRADSLPGDFTVAGLANAGGGRLWVGSPSGGLSLFDPQFNRVLPLPPAIARKGLAVTSLLGLPHGNVLVGTRTGIDRLLAAPALRLESVWRAPDPPTAAVAGMTRCPDAAVYAVAGNSIVAVPPAGAAHVLATAPRTIAALYCTPKGHLLLGDAAGLFGVNRQSGRIAPLWQGAPAPIGVTAITVDHAGHLWLGLANHTLLRIAANGAQMLVQPAPAGIRGGLPDSRILTLFVDRTGLLWAGTETAGVAWTRVDRGAITSVLDLGVDPRAPPYVRNLVPGAHGRVWLTMNGPGLASYDTATRTVTSFGPTLERLVGGARSASPPRVHRTADLPAYGTADDVLTLGVTRAADGSLLIASNRGVLRFDTATDRASFLQLDGRDDTTPARLVFRARNGDLWIAPFDGGLVHYHAGRVVRHFTPRDGLGSDNVFAVAEDPEGRIWAGTGNGLSLIEPGTGKVRTFREIPGRDNSLAGHTVLSILATRNAGVWVGSLSGISHLEHLGATGARFQRYGLANGLPDTTINCMLQGPRGDIWFSTNLGLGRLDPKTGAVRTFGPNDGTQGAEYNSGACATTAGGKLLFGGLGFDIVTPAAIQPLARKMPVALTGVYVGTRRVPIPLSASSVVKLPANDRNLHVTFAALDFASAGHNRFRHRLLGHNREWTLPGAAHSVTYTSLAPGRYQLEVQSLGRDGAPAGTARLAVRVAYAWWWTPAMRALYAAILVALLVIAWFAWRGYHLERARHDRQLGLRESRLRQALWGSGDEFWDWNLAHGTILRLGPETAMGSHHEESIAADVWRRERLHPDDIAEFDHALAEHLAGHTAHFEVEHRVRDHAGDWKWVVSRGRVIERAADGKPLRVCGTERDISALRAADRDRRIASEVIRNLSEAVAVTDLDFHFVSVNTAFTRMTGYAEAEVLGHDAALLDSSRHAADNYAHLRQQLAETGHWRGELWQRRKDGEEFLCWVELNEVCDPSGQRTHMIGVLTDITDRKRAEQELRYLANYDTLTGLPNRTLLGERLGAAVINARRSGQKLGLLFIDLDRFKHINDSLGHSTGDRTLKAAGARLRQCVRETDVVARLGGDEFTVVLEDLADARGAEDMAQRLIRAFTRPLPIGGAQEAVISPSIGIAIYPDHGQAPADLLKHADTAMYQAKEHGRNTWTLYHPGMDARAHDHATLVTALRRALDRNELSMVYQPKLAIHGGHGITGMEALLRWHSHELGDVEPSVFIPLAEESGQIHEISAYVFATACADLRRFRESGHAKLTMAINLSAAQLTRPDLTLHICDLLAEHDVVPSQVELELTETMVMANAEQSVRVLNDLKSIGTRLAIDDFGTGYSSLAYLKRLPIDTLKVDQAFVGDVTTDPDDASITATIIAMAHSLQLKVVAEGVETPEQLAFLRNQQCDEVQGYLVSRPLTADACLAFLEHCRAHPLTLA
ncbi:MAG TPA: EAL domain-containing protein [Rhodanobacteraceae bacterium]